jgi:iron complex transport system ATP-binding protein
MLESEFMEALSAKHVSFSYVAAPVIDDITLTINQGAFVGMIGPNGAGKSTLLRLFCRILVPDKGTIRLYGDDLAMMTNKARAQQIAFVPQETHFALNFAVEDIVTMGRFPYLKPFEKLTSKDSDAIDNAFHQTQTEMFRTRPIMSLSSGERQRVVLARALAQEPKILLLDEPSSHLDIQHQHEIMESLRKLHDHGTTIIIVHHDLNLASLYCEHLIVLHKGKVFSRGDPEAILTREMIHTVYNTDVAIIKNPTANAPHVMFKTKRPRT